MFTFMTSVYSPTYRKIIQISNYRIAEIFIENNE